MSLDNYLYSDEVWNTANERFGEDFVCKIKGYKIMKQVLTQ